jgi:hypothetical protein
MMPAPRARTLMWNEARALLPAWLAAAAAASVAALASGDVHQFAQIAFAAATVAIGAQSIGHDYAHRTVGLLLMLPVDRRRLYLTKLAVVAALVLPLAAYAASLGLFVDLPALRPWVIAAVALCVAPALTMLCRSQLAGTIFGVSVPMTLLIAVLTASGAAWDVSRIGDAAFAAWSLLMAFILVAGGICGWRLFRRLESIEGGVAPIDPTWLTTRRQRVTPSHPLVKLVAKEVRLQQISFAVAVLYVGACGAAAVFDIATPDPTVSFAEAATLVYMFGMPALIGSLASAEERQLGTLAWQLQLPMATGQQWAAKMATVFGLTIVLSVWVPMALAATVRSIDWSMLGQASVLAIAMTAVSMYVSSLCTSAVRAMVASAIAISFALWLVLGASIWRGREAWSLALLAVVIVLLAGFARVNHRPEAPGAARTSRQLLSMAVVIGFGLLVVQFASR